MLTVFSPFYFPSSNSFKSYGLLLACLSGFREFQRIPIKSPLKPPIMKRLNHNQFICLLIFSIISFITNAQSSSGEWANSPVRTNVSNDSDTSFSIVVSANHTYGYEIFIRNKIVIRQLTIPCKSGIGGFTNKLDAEKVARLVIKKLSHGMMPPTVNKQELTSLKIDF